MQPQTSVPLATQGGRCIWGASGDISPQRRQLARDGARTCLVAGAVALTVLWFSQGFALAQSVTALSPEVHFYASPMVLEYSLGELIQKRSAATTSVALHSCRGITIESLSLRLARVGQMDSHHVITTEKFQRLRMTLTLFNNSGKDKRVAVHFDFVHGDLVTPSSVEVSVNLQQGEKEASDIQMPFLLEERESETPNPAPRLRITLSAVDY